MRTDYYPVAGISCGKWEAEKPRHRRNPSTAIFTVMNFDFYRQENVQLECLVRVLIIYYFNTRSVIFMRLFRPRSVEYQLSTK